MKAILVAIVVLLVFSVSYAGDNLAKNIDITERDRSIFITYDLSGRDKSEVILLVTLNGKQVKIKNVFGDFGKNINPGTGLAIEWKYLRDFPEGLDGDVVIDVIAMGNSEPDVSAENASSLEGEIFDLHEEFCTYQKSYKSKMTYSQWGPMGEENQRKEDFMMDTGTNMLRKLVELGVNIERYNDWFTRNDKCYRRPLQ